MDRLERSPRRLASTVVGLLAWLIAMPAQAQ
jgi:hypothetical protein